MKKTIALLLAVIMCVSVTACGTGNTEAETVQEQTQPQPAEEVAAIQEDSSEVSETDNTSDVKVAKDGADMQTEEKDPDTAKAFIEKLPMTQHVSRYSHDFCGVTEDLPYNEDEVHYGWLNGDIDYAINAPYFTILFEDEDKSEQYGDQVNIGVITVPLSEIAALEGSYDVRIELAE